jgi:hypothetical protein
LPDGVASNYAQGFGHIAFSETTDWAFFAQDDWRISTHITQAALGMGSFPNIP